jgi:gliding motility-associated-like protein
MFRINTILVSLFFVCWFDCSCAQMADKRLAIKPLQDKVFIKENGQFAKNARETQIPFANTVFYGVENAEFDAYFTSDGIIFLFPERRLIEKEEEKEEAEKKREEKTIETIWHTAKMKWVNSNPLTEVIAEQRVSNYYNYGNFTANADDIETFNFVPAYKKLTYKNLYPGVDAEFELPEEGGIKYRLIIKPNIEIPNIAIEWEGLKKITEDKEGLLHLISDRFKRGSVNKEWHILEHAPVAFTKNSHKNIDIKYNVENTKITFQFLSEKNSGSEGIIIDPWITNTNYPDLNRAFDIQEDSLGNIFTHGNHTNYHVEKYNSLGVLQWSYVTYSVFLGDIAVDNPGNVYIIGGYCTGKRQKLDPSGVQQWSQSGLCEEWRLAFNYSKTTLAICGYFVNPGGNNLARLDLSNGAVSDEIAYNEETRAIATDCNGDMYSLHLPTSTLRKTNANFTPGGSVPSGLSLIYSGTGYALNPAYSGATFQGFNGILVQGPYLYIYDGTLLRRFDKATLTPINSVNVPGGVNYQCSGLAADRCGNVYAGATNSFAKFDSTLSFISSTPTIGPVYDLLLSSAGDLLACGEGFVARYNVVCTPPPPLTAVITSEAASCHGGKATIQVSGGIAPYGYLWQPGGQTTSVISHVPPGSYICTSTDPFCHAIADTVVVTAKPPLAVTDSSTKSCVNDAKGTATLVVTGGSSPYSYSWNSTPIQTTQTAINLYGGTYQAIVVDADTCSDTATVVVNTFDLSTSAYTANNSCLADSTIFINTSLNPADGTITKWSWDFGDASPIDSVIYNPHHLYSSAGDYTVRLITISSNLNCADTLKDTIRIYPLPVANFGFANVCFGVTANFHDSSTVPADTIASWSWNFGDNTALGTTQHPTHNYLSAGTYTVKLIVTTNHGCKDTIVKSIVIHPLPVVIFNANNVCDQNPVFFINFSSIPATDTIHSWTWNFGDSTALFSGHNVPGGHLYAHTGTYSVKLIEVSNFGCVDSVSNTVIIRPNPIASFVSNRVCNGTATAFTDSSITSGGTLSVWKWDFGDGTNPILTQNSTHVFANAGIHAVTLIVQNTFGCADTITKNCKVYFNPAASFTHQDICFKDSVHFLNTSTVDTSSTLATYYWLFDDGASSSLQHPAHYYNQSGTYHVTLLVKTVDSCSDAITMTVKVFDPPTAQFTVNDVCLFDSAHVVNTSISPIVGTISNWSWNLGDGSPINTNDLSPHHLYGAAGIYPIQLITHSSNLGCADTLNDSVTVFPMPIAAFNTSEVCFGTPSDFTDVSVVANPDTITTWSWDFGGGATYSAVQNPTRTFALYGAYSVTLISTTNHGCMDTVVHTSIIHPKPSPQFISHNVCLGSVVSFTDVSILPPNTSNDGVAAWTWTFGDNSALNNNQHPTHLYASSGIDTVQLKVTSDFGCSDSISKTVVIHPNPIVNFTRNDSIGCEPLCVSFQETASIASGVNQSWSWNYGDGSALVTGAQVNHCYHNDSVTAANYYSVSLTVLSDSGCVSTAIKQNYILVYPMPQAAFVASPQSTTIANPVISVTDLSIGASAWVWNWGGVGDSNITTPSLLPHTYADTGSYTITLLTSNTYPCWDSTQQTVSIEPDFLFYIPNSFTPNDDGVNDTFTGKGIFINEYEMSIFDRWGNLIYKTDSIDKPWDGKANKGNELSQKDVYVYVIKVTDFKLMKHNYRGTVTLIR